MFKYYIIHPSGLVIEETWPKDAPGIEWDGKVGWPKFERIKKDCRIPEDGLVEHVRVLYNDKEADMFVDENGIAKRLSINLRATYIYHNWYYRKRVGQESEDGLATRFAFDKYVFPPEWPPIVGSAVLWVKEEPK